MLGLPGRDEWLKSTNLGPALTLLQPTQAEYQARSPVQRLIGEFGDRVFCFPPDRVEIIDGRRAHHPQAVVDERVDSGRCERSRQVRYQAGGHNLLP